MEEEEQDLDAMGESEKEEIESESDELEQKTVPSDIDSDLGNAHSDHISESPVRESFSADENEDNKDKKKVAFSEKDEVLSEKENDAPVDLNASSSEDDHFAAKNKKSAKPKRRRKKKDTVPSPDSEPEPELIIQKSDSEDDFASNKKGKKGKGKKNNKAKGKEKVNKPMAAATDDVINPDNYEPVNQDIETAAPAAKPELPPELADKNPGAETHRCEKCRSVFPSKNKLYNHLKSTGHALYLPNKQAENTVKEEKKGMSKKKLKKISNFILKSHLKKFPN